jgi:predicted transcriptional regulator
MNTAEDITTSQGTGHYKPKGIAIERMLQLRDKNLTDGEIATIVGCDRSNVSKRLAEYAPKLQRIDNHKKYRADILTDLQMKVLDNFTPDKINECTVPQSAVVYGILYDKERIERGLSTSNLSIAGVIEVQKGKMDDITDTIARLTSELDSE